eukprot:COSAG01_NODE_3453_length_6077_cov_8.916527_7_plen_352_part_00
MLLMGESAGAGSVSCHLVSPQSFGLFRTAAMSSGAFSTWISSPMQTNPPADPALGAQATFDALVNESKCSSTNTSAVLACLEAIPASKLVGFAAVKSAAFGPTIDGVELRNTPKELLRQGKIDTSVKAILVGSVAEDSNIATSSGRNASAADFAAFLSTQYLFADFVKHNKSALPRLIQLYSNWSLAGPTPPVDAAGPFSQWYWASKHALADAEMFCPAKLAAEAFTKRGIPAYHFQFRHPPIEVACAVENCDPMAARHASDIPFWLSNRDGKVTVRSVEELQLAQYMSRTVLNLARGAKLDQKWPAWGEKMQPVMVLDVASSGGCVVKQRMRHELCEFWESVPDKYIPIM